MALEKQISNGAWVETQNQNDFIDMILAREIWFAPRQNRAPMTTHQQVLDKLATGAELKYDDQWYSVLRDGNKYAVVAEVEHQCGSGQRYDESCANCGRITTVCNDCGRCARCH